MNTNGIYTQGQQYPTITLYLRDAGYKAIYGPIGHPTLSTVGLDKFVREHVNEAQQHGQFRDYITNEINQYGANRLIQYWNNYNAQYPTPGHQPHLISAFNND